MSWTNNGASILSNYSPTNGGIAPYVCSRFIFFKHLHYVCRRCSTSRDAVASSNLLALQASNGLGEIMLYPALIKGSRWKFTPLGFDRIKGHPSTRRNCILCGTRTRGYCRGCSSSFMCGDACYIHVHTRHGHVATSGRR